MHIVCCGMHTRQNQRRTLALPCIEDVQELTCSAKSSASLTMRSISSSLSLPLSFLIVIFSDLPAGQGANISTCCAARDGGAWPDARDGPRVNVIPFQCYALP